MVVDDLTTFPDLLTTVEKHDDEIVNYFWVLIQAPQPALTLSADKSSSCCIVELEDSPSGSL